ncbi:outer dense fiber protein 3B [Corvus moneduloides]|uniref:outer dense fiber protein 3B n=1 Tax=Corvus moneduloides TaxID=1196302 RepID=UPI0013632071|nr:outer dense fiber protein 3B [Corvus moneduloides]
MSSEGWVGPWRPHRPRTAVSARFRTPGPKYELPGSIGCDPHDSASPRAPAYTFGHRAGGSQQPRSPGPQYLVPAGFTARGEQRGPAFSMGGRPAARPASSTPGPAYYRPERADRVTLPSAPACSMSFRGRPDTPQETPGPASYQLPPVMGSGLVNKRSAPQYSLTGRGPSIFDYKTRTPGPLNYNTVDTDVYMARAPRCTMAGRPRPRQGSITPGPGDYRPQQGQRQGQSFGVRHSEMVIPVMDPRL